METQQIGSATLAARDLMVGIAPFIAGIVVVLLLIGAVVLGKRLREREPAPSQEAQERSGAWQARHESDVDAVAGEHGPGHQTSVRHEESENREPDELKTEGRERRLPHEMGRQPSRTSPDQDRPRWDEGKSGSFGSGG